jgi:hypothetical protein
MDQHSLFELALLRTLDILKTFWILLADGWMNKTKWVSFLNFGCWCNTQNLTHYLIYLLPVISNFSETRRAPGKYHNEENRIICLNRSPPVHALTLYSCYFLMNQSLTLSSIHAWVWMVFYHFLFVLLCAIHELLCLFLLQINHRCSLCNYKLGHSEPVQIQR